MPSFYFEQLLQTGLNGIDQQGITTAVLQIAGIILIFSLLWAVYEAYSNGGDVRLLGVAAVKYLVLGLVFLNYQSAFRAVNMMFNGVADGMYNLTGAGDVAQSWMNVASNQWNGNQDWISSIWNLVTGGQAAILSALLTLVGYLLLPITYAFFTLFYAMYGAILYVVGPFVLALIPSRGLGRLGKTFVVNMLVFQSWGLLYAILQALMSALQISSAQGFINNTSFLNSFQGASSMILMSLASVLLSIMIALIPLIASRIVRGDVGSTLMTVISGAVTAGAIASGVASAAGGGVAAGRMAAPEGPPPPPPGGPGGGGPGAGSGSQGASAGSGSGQGPGSGSNVVLGESRPPTPPSPDTSSGASGTGVSTGSSESGAAASPSSAQAESGTPPPQPAGSEPPEVLWNPHTGQVFSWGGSGWQAAGHVSSPASSPLIQQNGGNYGVTNWTGGNAGQAARGYTGRSLAGLAVWQAGHIVGRTMRMVGMGKA